MEFEKLDKKSSSKIEFNWDPLESDPEIFSEYMHRVGLSNDYAFGEIYGLDNEMLDMLPSNISSIIINCSRIESDYKVDESKILSYEKVPFFMLQTTALDNACGAIAAIHSIANNRDNVEVTKDSILENFLESTKSKNPLERAEYLDTLKEFKSANKKSSEQGQSKFCETQEDVKGHFISFNLVSGNIVEFDGVFGKPIIVVENVKQEEFVSKVAEEIKKRLSEKLISESISMMYLAKN